MISSELSNMILYPLVLKSDICDPPFETDSEQEMCEVLSWREESWWERKSIPLGSHSISPRQLVLLATFAGLGDLISTMIPLALFGVIYLGKILPLLAMLAFGFVLGSRRIKMTPVEIQLFLKLSKNKALKPENRVDTCYNQSKPDATCLD
jgi:hypothetical protein